MSKLWVEAPPVPWLARPVIIHRCWLPRGCSAASIAAWAVVMMVPLVFQASSWGVEVLPGDPVVQPDLPVTATNLVDTRANNSPSVAVDPTEPRFVALASRVDLPEFDCKLHVSGDGGRGWLPVDPVPRVPLGAERCYAPEIAFDRDGILYYLFVGLRGRANVPVGAYLTTSSDRGRSFSTPRRLLGPHSFAVRMAIDTTSGDKGRVHLVWIQAGAPPSLGGFPPVPNPIMAKHSDDGGKSFSAPVQVSDPERERVVAPALAVGPDGRVHVLYYDLGDDAVDYQGLEGPTWEGTWTLVLASSVDGGGRFSGGVVVDDELVPPERVALIFTMAPPSLVAGTGGSLYSAWHDARNGDWDVFVRRSTDGGRSWGEIRRLNDDPVGNGRHQYQPRLSLSPSGRRLDAVFYDRRDDLENIRNDVFFTNSRDGGASFAPNTRLTTALSSARLGPMYPIPSARGLVEFGSRLGLVSQEDWALAAWTDTRNSHPTEQQDVFATEVTFDSASRPAPSSPPRDRGLERVLRVLLPSLCIVLALLLVVWWRARRRPGRTPESRS